MLREESGFTAQLRQRAAQDPMRLVLPEGEDPRVLDAAVALHALGMARPVLLMGAPARLRRRLAEQGADPEAFTLIDAAQDPRADAVAARLFERRRAKGLTQGEAKVLAREPLQLGAGLVAAGEADAMVGGAAHPTADVLRAALFHVGLAPGVTVVSGSFLMVPPPGHGIERPLLFADSAVVPQPDDDQLVSIGVASAATYRAVVGRQPRIACLSFSTKGSADHPAARRMAEVARRLRARGLVADGELQLDAALVPSVAAGKCPDSPVGGFAEVLLFPDLGAANIGYKLAQRLGGFAALGPILQGLARPVFDLSRGCKAADIVNTAAIAALFCRAGEESGRA
jgi:phosphate acetyltransferase